MHVNKKNKKILQRFLGSQNSDAFFINNSFGFAFGYCSSHSYFSSLASLFDDVVCKYQRHQNMYTRYAKSTKRMLATKGFSEKKLVPRYASMF